MPVVTIQAPYRPEQGVANHRLTGVVTGNVYLSDGLGRVTVDVLDVPNALTRGYVFASGGGGGGGGGSIMVPDLPGLIALPSPGNGGVAILTDPMRGGTFVFRTGDYSMQVAADPGQGVYVASSSVPSTSGAWVRLIEGPFNLGWFGLQTNGFLVDTSYTVFTPTAPTSSQSILVNTGGSNFPANSSVLISDEANSLTNWALGTVNSWTPTTKTLNVHVTSVGSTPIGGRAFTVTNSGGLALFTLVAHGFSQNQRAVLSGGSLPSPFKSNQIYYIYYQTVDTFVVTTTFGGQAIAFAAGGSGTISNIWNISFDTKPPVDNSIALANFGVFGRYYAGINGGIDTVAPPGRIAFNIGLCDKWCVNLGRWVLNGANTSWVNIQNSTPSGFITWPFAPWWGLLGGPTQSNLAAVKLTANSVVATNTFQVATADAARFVIGQTCVIMSFQAQGAGYPPNPQLFDYMTPISIGAPSGGNVIITCVEFFKYEHRMDWPDLLLAGQPNSQYGAARAWFLYTGTTATFTGSISGSTLTIVSGQSGVPQTNDYVFGVNVVPGTQIAFGGGGSTWPLTISNPTIGAELMKTVSMFSIADGHGGFNLVPDLNWNIDYTFVGPMTWEPPPYAYGLYQNMTGEKITTIDLTAPGPSESVTRKVNHYNYTMTGQAETDKINESITYYSPRSPLFFNLQSPNENIHIIDGYFPQGLGTGATKLFVAENCVINATAIGAPGQTYGVASQQTFRNCKIINQSIQNISRSTLLNGTGYYAGPPIALTFNGTATIGGTQTFAANQAVRLFNNGSNPPSPFALHTDYYVFNPTGSNFQLTAAPGVGPAIIAGGSATGVNAVVSNGFSGAILSYAPVTFGGIAYGAFTIPIAELNQFVGWLGMYPGAYIAFLGGPIAVFPGDPGVCRVLHTYQDTNNIYVLTDGPQNFPAFCTSYLINYFQINEVTYEKCNGSDLARIWSEAAALGYAPWERVRYVFSGQMFISGDFSDSIGTISEIDVNIIKVSSSGGCVLSLAWPSYNMGSNYTQDSGGLQINIDCSTAVRKIKLTRSSAIFTGGTGSDTFTVGGVPFTFLPSDRVVQGLSTYSVGQPGGTPPVYGNPTVELIAIYDTGQVRKSIPVQFNLAGGPSSSAVNQLINITGILP